MATDKMKSLGLLSEKYNTTIDFANELSKHYRIAKICDSANIENCWPTEKIKTTYVSVDVKTLTNGEKIKALGIGTKNTQTVGIVTAEGYNIIMTYSPKCIPLDPAKTYSWSTVDNKPETNATTNCISAIIDINCKTGSNKLGYDVRTLNSIFGYKNIGRPDGITKEKCLELKDKLGIKACTHDTDRFAAAVQICNNYGLQIQAVGEISGPEIPMLFV